MKNLFLVKFPNNQYEIIESSVGSVSAFKANAKTGYKRCKSILNSKVSNIVAQKKMFHIDTIKVEMLNVKPYSRKIIVKNGVGVELVNCVSVDGVRLKGAESGRTITRDGDIFTINSKDGSILGRYRDSSTAKDRLIKSGFDATLV